MWLRITHLLSLFFPLTQDEKNIANLTPADFKELYCWRNIDGVSVLSSFKQKEVRAAIHLNKFHNNSHAQRLLGVLLTEFLTTYTKTDSALLIPVPLSAVRRRKRGHNQVESILKHTAFDNSRFSATPQLLKKVRDTKPQTSLDKVQRCKNLQDAYRLVDDAHFSLEGKHIILIDDVMTTGTTLKEAKSALEKGTPATIVCVALAH